MKFFIFLDNVLFFFFFFIKFLVTIVGDEKVQKWPLEEAVEGEGDFQG